MIVQREKRVPRLPGPRHPDGALLVTLRKWIGLHQLRRFVDQIVLAIEPRAADASLAPEMMILVDADVAFRRTLEFHARRSGGDLVDVERARLLGGELPQPGTEIGGLGHVADDGLLAPHLLERGYEALVV